MNDGYPTLRELVEAEGIDRDQLLSSYSDMYKERNGIRPRWNYGLSKEHLIEEMEKMAADDRREIEAEDAREREEKRGTKIKCIYCDSPNGMFSVGKVYHRGENWLLEDDLGYARFVGSGLRFLLGSCANEGLFAKFEIVED